MRSSNPHSGCREVETSKTLDTTSPDPSKNQGGIAIVEALPFDTTQVTSPQNGNNPKWGDPCHPLAATGHPPTVICKARHLFENHSQDTRYKGPLDVCPMLPAQLGTGGNNTPLVVEESTPIYSLQGNMIGRADQNGPQGDGVNEGVSFTLNTIDRHAVAYCIGNGQTNQISMAEQSNTLDCMHDKQAVLIAPDPIAIDRAFFNQDVNAKYEPQLYEDGTTSTLVAKGPSAVCVRYIVRRLTPTECARLQGFADRWGEIDVRDSFTAEELEFWRNVRNTHAAINGKPTKEYTEKQMLVWYNRLHTDAAEYKMWGNGIALPTALYCMQGIADALQKEVIEEWML